MGSIDAKLLKVLNRRRTKQIAAHAGDHENLSPAKPGGHSLIRALASKPKIELLSKNCFPSLRETIGKGSQVNVCAANHGEARTLPHKIAESSQRHQSLSMNFTTESQRNRFLVFSLFCDSVIKGLYSLAVRNP